MQSFSELMEFENQIRTHFGSKFGVMKDSMSRSQVPPYSTDYYFIPPNPLSGHNFWIILTSGMSNQPMSTSLQEYQYCEFMMFLDSDQWNLNLNCAMGGHPMIPSYPPAKNDFRGDESLRWPLISLKKIMMYPHMNRTWVGHYHTLDMEGQHCGNYHGFLLKKSQIFPAEAELFHVNGKHINLYVAIPVFQNEMNIAQKSGCEELISLFDKHNVNEITQLHREPVKNNSSTKRSDVSNREKYFI